MRKLEEKIALVPMMHCIYQVEDSCTRWKTVAIESAIDGGIDSSLCSHGVGTRDAGAVSRFQATDELVHSQSLRSQRE